ncbi:MAG: putative porin [Bacteroidia bacterium]
MYKRLHHHFRIFNCTALFIISAFQLSAQKDSLAENRFRFFLADQVEHQTKVVFVDSGFLNGFQITNPFFFDYTNASGYLGNLGSALRTDYFGLNNDLNFYYRQDFYSSYHFNDHPVGFDGSRNIHSMMEYYRGAKKEQDFQFSHSQRLGKNCAFGLDYKNTISPSFYKRAVTNSRAFDFYFIFETGNSRYSAFADYVSNRTDNNINGGLVSDTSLENVSGIDIKTLPVNLDDAQWLTKQKSYVFKHQFNFKIASHPQPASKSDTTLKASIINVPLIFLHHDFNYSKYGELFTSSNDSAVWPANYYDPLTTVDTASTEQFLNSVYFQSLLWNEKIKLNIGANNQYMVFKQHDIDSNITHTSVFASGAIDINQQLDAGIYYEQNINGDANSAYMMKADLSYAFANSKWGKLNLVLINVKQPAYIMANVYRTNHFIHNNDFALINRQVINIDYSHRLFSTGVRMNSLKNFVYYDSTASPTQNQSYIGYTSAYLKFNIRLRKFNWINDFNFVSNRDKDVIHLPAASIHASIFYDDYLFKNAMRAQVGFDVFYNTTYYADAFMPALQEFYIQEKNKTGNYPFIDFFASAKIRTAKIFIKVENIGSGWIGKNYFITPGYPMQGRGMRFGLQWSFFS